MAALKSLFSMDNRLLLGPAGEGAASDRRGSWQDHT